MTVAVNGRFTRRPVTGVERYASEITLRLCTSPNAECTVLAPRREMSGVAGHLWEQTVLPVNFRRSGAQVLLSLCNVGPVSVATQLVVIHDVAPFLHPKTFTKGYGTQVRALQRMLARRCTIATVSERSRRDLARVLGLDPERIALVPPAVGAPFTAPAAGAGGRRCVFVGGHDERKNLGFVLSLWSEVHRRTGLQLDVVARRTSATVRSGGQAGDVPGVRWHLDPDDEKLAALYGKALCVLSPSRYEGFGLPLLEGMACGTPFLATDTGAAAELAVDPDEQLLPLDARAWTRRLAHWGNGDPPHIREASRLHAQRWSWDRSAAALLMAAQGAVAT